MEGAQEKLPENFCKSCLRQQKFAKVVSVDTGKIWAKSKTSHRIKMQAVLLLAIAVPAAAFIPAGLPLGLAPVRLAASLAPSALLCRPRSSVPRLGRLAAFGARMSAQSDMQVGTDCLMVATAEE